MISFKFRKAVSERFDEQKKKNGTEKFFDLFLLRDCLDRPISHPMEHIWLRIRCVFTKRENRIENCALEKLPKTRKYAETEPCAH